MGNELVEGEVVEGTLQDIREKAKNLAEEILSKSWEFAKVLVEIREQGLYKEWGYDTLVEYALSELGFSDRMLRYYCKNWQVFGLQLGYEPSDLSGLEITKADVISRVVNSDNADEWISKARDLSRKDLMDQVKTHINFDETRGDDGTPGASVDEDGNVTLEDERQQPTEWFRVPLAEDQYANVKAALKMASKITGKEEDSINLDMVCLSFRQEHVDLNYIEEMLSEIQRVSGKLVFCVDLEDPDLEDVLKDLSAEIRRLEAKRGEAGRGEEGEES